MFLRRCGVIPPDLTSSWDKYSCYASGGVGLLLLFLRRLGVVTFVVPPAAWARSFCYASHGSGTFLLFLRWIRVVTFVMPLGAWCLVRLMLACNSQRGFGLIDAGSP